MSNEIGIKVREQIAEAGLTVEHVAEQTGIADLDERMDTESTFYVHELAAVAKILDCLPSVLIA